MMPLRRFRSADLACSLVLTAVTASSGLGAPTLDARGGQFIWFNRFGGFEESQGSRLPEKVFTSPVIAGRIEWDELVVSWNAELPPGTYLRMEARAWYPAGPTRYYSMGLWSNDPQRYPRESTPGQDDEHGTVATDTLILKQPATRFQLRISLGGETREYPRLKFLGAALTDSRWNAQNRRTGHRLDPGASNPEQAVEPPSNTEGSGSAWGLVLPVPERSQMLYPNGNVLCSPTSLSMILSYWAEKLHRPELGPDVPEIARAIYDPKWRGTGNWVFNTAYAGSFPGMRAYVARLSQVSELEDWIAQGVPVALSLCYDRLRGKTPKGEGSGHLVVCVGFTDSGDPIINDPGTSRNVRKIFPRRNLVSAWAYSRNAVYLVYPEGNPVPSDRFGHWASWTAKQRIRLE